MIFPTPKHEQYFEKSYAMKAYDENLDLLYLYEKYKNGNEDLTIKNDVTLKEDAYILEIDENGITVTAGYENGVFRAVTSLKQLLKQNGASLPYCEVKDDPDFVKRSYMLDISRCRMLKPEYICRLIDLLADLKYNEFQLYMESFCFKYDTLSEYTKDFDCLDADDIKFLDQYCADRFIDLVPNQNCFGHLALWLDQDEFKHLRIGNDEVNTGTINPLLDESFEFVDKLFSALLPNFRSEYVNIGLDEAYGLGKYQIEELCNEIGPENVFMDWLNKVADHIKKKYNKKVQFWSDMVCGYPESFKRVPEGAIALNWGYDIAKTALLERRCMDLKAKNTPYYICPGNATWIALTGRFDVCSVNLRACGEFGREHGAIGYMVTDWGCGEGHTHFPVWSLVPAALGGQYAWNVGEPQNGGTLKAHNIHNSEKYIDENIFGGAKVSRWLYKLAQYYLLEPERIHCSTMCGFIIRKPLNETAVEPFFDLKDCGDDFYFENVTAYVQKCIDAVEKIDFDENWKRQVIVNAKMVILSSDLCIIRMHQTAENDEIDRLVALIDEIHEEYTYLWDKENYPEGKDHFLSQIRDRKKELLAMRK
ncbi:MAG: family 20 glycosylhydrolase [Clostridia bacterium]|nr:family 20 glycosylhydrolase [Clostridia bacterium]